MGTTFSHSVGHFQIVIFGSLPHVIGTMKSWPPGFACVLCFFTMAAWPRLQGVEPGAPVPAEVKEAPVHLSSREIRVHDPSTIVKCKDEYWTFATGNGIVSHRSKDLVKWADGPRVFSTSPPWITNSVPGNRGHFWAPDIVQTTHGYFLYYSVSTWGKRTSAIALARNGTLDPADANFHWSDEGIVVQTSESDNFNAIDPAVTRDELGNLWLSFGSFWSGLKLIQLDPATGKRLAPDSPVYSLAHYSAIEAPYIHSHAGYYYLFLNWDRCCRGTNSTYNIRIGRGQKITGPYLDKNGVDLLKGGGTLFLGTEAPFIGPGHAGIFSENGTNWFSCHFYDGNRRGLATLGIGQLEWTGDGWPQLLPVAGSPGP